MLDVTRQCDRRAGMPANLSLHNLAKLAAELFSYSLPLMSLLNMVKVRH